MALKRFLPFVCLIATAFAQFGGDDVDLLLANVDAQEKVVFSEVAKTPSDLEAQSNFTTQSVEAVSSEIEKLSAKLRQAKASNDTPTVDKITSQLQSAAKVESSVLNKAQSSFSSVSGDKALNDQASKALAKAQADAKAQAANISAKEKEFGIKLDKPNVSA